MRPMQLPVDDILVDDRHCRDLGDLAALAAKPPTSLQRSRAVRHDCGVEGAFGPGMNI